MRVVHGVVDVMVEVVVDVVDVDDISGVDVGVERGRDLPDSDNTTGTIAFEFLL